MGTIAGGLDGGLWVLHGVLGFPLLPFLLSLSASNSFLDPEPLTAFLRCSVRGLLLCAFKAESLQWAKLTTLGSRSLLCCLVREGLIFHVCKDV